MKINILLALLAGTLFSCSKAVTFPATYTPAVAFVADTIPPQYGTPFSGVPDRRDANIYQVNMRAFSAAGNFAGVTARLDSIKALGINVIYLMPIYPVGVVKTINSPYCVKDYLSVNAEFGTLTDLRTLVDGAHSRNMSVILDFVANHTSWDNAWITAHKEWYVQDGSGNITSPPGYTDVAQLNFSSAAMKLQMTKDMRYWVYTANVDGFRCDDADSPSLDFWTQAIDTLRNITSHKLLMLAEGTRSGNFTVGFDYNFGFSFYGNLKSIYSSNAAVTTIDALNTSDYVGTTTGQQMVRYITNHDVNSSDGTPLGLFGGKTGSLAAFAVSACMKSVPMIYDGQEVGMTAPIVFPFTSTKIDFTTGQDVTASYKKILAIRNSSAAIRRGDLASYSTADVCAFTKISGTETVLVIANLRNATINYTVPAAYTTTTWTNTQAGGTTAIGTQLSLAPYSFMILQKM